MLYVSLIRIAVACDLVVTNLVRRRKFGDLNTVLIIVLAGKYFKVKNGSRLCSGYFWFQIEQSEYNS